MQRILVMGGSAGGHLSLMVGMTPESASLGQQSRFRGVIDFFGITDVPDQLQGREHARLCDGMGSG